MIRPEMHIHRYRGAKLWSYLLAIGAFLLAFALVVEFAFHGGEGWIKIVHLFGLLFPGAVLALLALDLRNSKVVVEGTMLEQFDYRGHVRKRQDLRNIQSIEFDGDPDRAEVCKLRFKDGTVVQISSILTDYSTLLGRVRNHLLTNASELKMDTEAHRI